MKFQFTGKYLPKHIWLLLFVYFVASLAHFTHNAEYIAFYPNMPAWITRNTVYVAWLVITAVGVAGLIASRMKWHAMGAVLIALYGAFGLDGLLHYTLALCSQHTLMTNITIWSEALSGLILMLASAVVAKQRFCRLSYDPAYGKKLQGLK